MPYNNKMARKRETIEWSWRLAFIAGLLCARRSSAFFIQLSTLKQSCEMETSRSHLLQM